MVARTAAIDDRVEVVEGRLYTGVESDPERYIEQGDFVTLHIHSGHREKPHRHSEEYLEDFITVAPEESVALTLVNPSEVDQLKYSKDTYTGHIKEMYGSSPWLVEQKTGDVYAFNAASIHAVKVLKKNGRG